MSEYEAVALVVSGGIVWGFGCMIAAGCAVDAAGDARAAGDRRRAGRLETAALIAFLGASATPLAMTIAAIVLR